MRDFDATCRIATGVVAALAIGAGPIDFLRDVRPILSDKCFHCHGPDSATRQAELRLDRKDGAFAEREGRMAFRPGEPQRSEALRRILSDDPDERMPPPSSKLSLSADERSRLRQWIAEGAKWGEHWAFVAPVEPPLPAVKRTAWPKNEIDRFVLARLEAAGLEPASEAARESLIRRATLDLTGLPPTVDEVDAFLADPSPDAYEKVVDRLLRSERYGERMAWEWLDAARYADTDGFQGDPTRTMWPWRDWLVRALNENVPFDRFTIETLAGDLLPGATPEQTLASAFNRNHMFNGEGGRIADETRVENVFDRAETTATVWLGLTLTCCRCHDHKYDPLTQREYYGLYAFFNNTSESGSSGRQGKNAPALDYLPPPQRSELETLKQRVAELERRRDAPHPELDAKQTEWEVAEAKRLAALAGTKVAAGPWRRLGPIPAPDGDAKKAFDADLGPEQGLRLDGEHGPTKLTWREDPAFMEGKVHELPATVGATYFHRRFTSPDARRITASLGSDDGIKVWLNGKSLLAKNVARAAAADQEALTFDLRAGENDLLVKVVNTAGIGGFYFRQTGESFGGVPESVGQALTTAAEKRTDAQRTRLREWFREQRSDEWKKFGAELAAATQARDKLAQTAVTVMVMDELPAAKRRRTTILVRGAYDKPGEVATEAVPAFLPPLSADAPKNRLALAQWLVDPANPLTARVTVNRYWQTFFGRGLVATTEDFGSQGSLPSHPELLDWLAVRFRTSGWDVKGLHRAIVTSATYRQSAVATAAARERDAENRLLSRSPRHRLPSWMLRDQALAASGLLMNRLGGPPVKPYQPDDVWAEATFGKIRYVRGTGSDLYRRSLYVFWRRIVGPTMFFDSGKRQTCEVKPTRTNTPLHALTTLNETAFVEASRALAERALTVEATSIEDRVVWAFRTVTTRRPTDAERDVLAARWRRSQAEFAAKPETASALLAVGDAPRNAKLDPSEHAAATVVCSILLNLDETLTRE